MENKTIYGYTLLRKLGAGGMAEVWYAENSIGKVAAVKILSKKLSDEKNVVERFANEARVMVKLTHPNIRQVYDYGMIDDRPCIVMEYLEGEDLGTLIKEGTLFTQAQIIKWWNQMVSALMYTHQLGIVHRDIKPSNIFITKEGNVELLDFGIAKVADSYLSTLSGMSMGTPMYMSPEQVQSSKYVDYRSDFYSLAVTFVHLLSGKAPYSSELSVYSLHKSIVEEPLDLGGIPKEWQIFLSPYLAKQPEDRPALREFSTSFIGTGKQVEGCTEVQNLSEWTIVDDKSAPNREKLVRSVSKGLLMGIVACVILMFGLGLLLYKQVDKIDATSKQLVLLELQRDSLAKVQAYKDSLNKVEVAAKQKEIEKLHKSTAQPKQQVKSSQQIAKPQAPSTVPPKKKEQSLQQQETQSVAQNERKEEDKNTNQSFVETDLGLDIRMVYVEGGEFLMGATTEQGTDAVDMEKPVRRVKLDSYYIGECEITQRQWEKVMGTSIYHQGSKADGIVIEDQVRPDYPMFYVSWMDAQAFCKKLSSITGKTYFLPTEAQWEYAARGGKYSNGTKFSGSSSVDVSVWYKHNGGNSKHYVKSKQANELGLYNMCGNIWEWCMDWFYKYNTEDLDNPKGPLEGKFRVLRGGSYAHEAIDCRVTSRACFSPDEANILCGFRVVMIP